MSFKSWIVKKVLPKEETIAKSLVDGFADWLNSLEVSTTQKIELGSNWTLKATALLNEISTLLKDGKISAEEKLLLIEKITPFITKAKDKILAKL